MLNYGISPEVILSGSDLKRNADELMNKEPECNKETASRHSENYSGKASVPLAEDQPMLHSNDPLSNKRPKVIEPVEGSSIQLKATESSILDWIKNFDGGVSAVSYL